MSDFWRAKTFAGKSAVNLYMDVKQAFAVYIKVNFKSKKEKRKATNA